MNDDELRALLSPMHPDGIPEWVLADARRAFGRGHRLRLPDRIWWTCIEVGLLGLAWRWLVH